MCYYRPRAKNGKVYRHSECDMCHNRINKDDRRAAIGARRARRREYERMYRERMRRRLGIPPRFAPVPASFPAYPIWVELQRWITEVLIDVSTGRRLNGRPIDETDTRRLNRWKSGEQSEVEFATLDAFAIKYDIPLWELELAAEQWERTQAASVGGSQRGKAVV